MIYLKIALKKVPQNETELNEEMSVKSGLTKTSKKIHKDHPTSYSKKQKKNDKTIDNSKVKRIPWQPYEDAQVIEFVSKYGPKWAKIASSLPGRTGKQVRDRYTNKLRPNINKDEWTKEEEEIFTSLCQEMGHKWSKIASYLPGRTEGQVKNRYYAQFRKKTQNENDQTSMSVSEGLGSMEHDFTNIKEANSTLLNIKTQDTPAYHSIIDSGLETYMQTFIAEGRNQVNNIKNTYKTSHDPSSDIQMSDPTSVISYEGGMDNDHLQRTEQNENYFSDLKFNPVPYHNIDMNPVSLNSHQQLSTNHFEHAKLKEEDAKRPTANHCCASVNVLNECEKLSKRMDGLESLLLAILQDMRDIKFRENASNPSS